MRRLIGGKGEEGAVPGGGRIEVRRFDDEVSRH